MSTTGPNDERDGVPAGHDDVADLLDALRAEYGRGPAPSAGRELSLVLLTGDLPDEEDSDPAPVAVRTRRSGKVGLAGATIAVKVLVGTSVAAAAVGGLSATGHMPSTVTTAVHHVVDSVRGTVPGHGVGHSVESGDTPAGSPEPAGVAPGEPAGPTTSEVAPRPEPAAADGAVQPAPGTPVEPEGPATGQSTGGNTGGGRDETSRPPAGHNGPPAAVEGGETGMGSTTVPDDRSTTSTPPGEAGEDQPATPADDRSPSEGGSENGADTPTPNAPDNGNNGNGNAGGNGNSNAGGSGDGTGGNGNAPEHSNAGGNPHVGGGGAEGNANAPESNAGGNGNGGGADGHGSKGST